MPTLESLISEKDYQSLIDVAYRIDLENRQNAIYNLYKKDLEEVLQDKKYQEIMCKNYPHLTREQIEKWLRRQQNIKVRFYHKHDGITEQIIKKYCLIGSDIDTIETNETHSCNCVEIPPNLKNKTYWAIRWDRNTISHMINGSDYPNKHTTNTLTVHWRLKTMSIMDDNWKIKTDSKGEKQTEEVFSIGTCYRWPSSPPEPWKEWASIESENFRKTHALFPEPGEKTSPTEAPEWDYKYMLQEVIPQKLSQIIKEKFANEWPLVIEANDYISKPKELSLDNITWGEIGKSDSFHPIFRITPIDITTAKNKKFYVSVPNTINDIAKKIYQQKEHKIYTTEDFDDIDFSEYFKIVED